MALSLNKKLVPRYSTKDLKVYTVNPSYVCKEHDISYVGGSHSFADNYVPPYTTHGEIWISEGLTPLEFKYFLLHELYEYRLMLQGFNYRDAHRMSSILEKKARRGTTSLVTKMLRAEFRHHKGKGGMGASKNKKTKARKPPKPSSNIVLLLR